ncbi:unnamed protein product [Rotaria sp. Silwood1]|nr:unnamed protein product [Rotaria sp. Silwood1]CAF1644323.1 unnamed protein product [Rotaria sp. Silwood1]CAF3903898.1 unnamed protein product [Rotaria sp. Silwood1]CAF5007888.1 unnamed protein product [Rotaria sp. Silwood1]CAF5075960.1 unnamed protein product [Rotaria sp. Silwood1]
MYNICGTSGEFLGARIWSRSQLEKTETQAKETVECISHGSIFSIEGDFQVKLNRYNIDASNKDIGNSVYWTGTIVHEMLHNLDHKHKDNDYSSQWQINTFKKCFIYNGNYSS